MKKVLLTTTALVLTAGVASAEITFSGTAEAGFYRTGKVKAGTAATKGKYTASASAITYDATATAATTTAEDVRDLQAAHNAQLADTTASDTVASDTATQLALEAGQLNLAHITPVAEAKTGDMVAYSGYDFNVAASGASDNGMTFAVGFDMGAGLIADQDDDRAMDAQAGTIATSAMTIGYAGYTVEIGDDKIDDLYDDTQNGDVSIAGSLGDLTFKLVTDMDDDVKKSYASASSTGAYVAGKAAVWNPTSYSIGYSMGDISFSMAGTEHDDRGNDAAKMSLTYKMLPSLSATFSSDNVGTYKDIGKVSATYTLTDAMSITASVKDDKKHALNTNKDGKQSQDVSIAYAAGAMSATLATDESSNWWVNAKYDLGGGATAFTTFDHTEFLVAGVNFAF